MQSRVTKRSESKIGFVERVKAWAMIAGAVTIAIGGALLWLSYHFYRVGEWRASTIGEMFSLENIAYAILLLVVGAGLGILWRGKR